MSKKTQKNTETALQEYKPSQAMSALFDMTPGNAIAQIDAKKIERRNLPQMLKPGDVPVGSAITGEIVKVVNSPVTTVKGKLLWLRHENGMEFLFPVTGSIRAALCPGISKDEDGLTVALEKEIGKILIARRTADKQSEKYKKSMFMFDVYTVKA